MGCRAPAVGGFADLLTDVQALDGIRSFPVRCTTLKRIGMAQLRDIVPMMDLDDLRTFVEVVEAGGDQQSRAAAWRGKVRRQPAHCAN